MENEELKETDESGGSPLNDGLCMNIKTVTTMQQFQKNSVEDMLLTLKQADQSSIVKDEKGRPVTAYLDPLTMSIVIVVDDDV
jgi:hypothetical protein